MERQDKLDFIAQSIARAKKVMERVETPVSNKPTPTQSYSEEQYDNMDVDSTKYLTEEQVMNMRGAIPQQAPQYDLYSDNERELPMYQPMSEQKTPQFRPYKNLNSTKMPKEIVESFLNKPMIDPTQPVGMETLIQKVAQKEGRPKQITETKQVPKPKVNTQIPLQETTTSNSGMDMQLLEFVIKKTVEETLKQVSEQTNINENIQIKIGDKTFGGTIKTLKNIKTK
jgi:hypothetical protein